jgi:3-oxoacyl-[acyl-carrier protein] reductase
MNLQLPQSIKRRATMSKNSKKTPRNSSKAATDPTRKMQPTSPNTHPEKLDPGDELLLDLARGWGKGEVNLGSIMETLNQLAQNPRYQKVSDKEKLVSLFSWAARLCRLPILETGLIGNLAAKVALVSNASHGVGASIALALAEAGADVILTYSNDEERILELQTKIRSLNQRCLALQADVSDPNDVREMFSKAENHFHRVHILVNNPLTLAPVSAEAMDEIFWDAIVNNLLKPAFLLTQAVMPGMRSYSWGRIINISDVAWEVGSSNPARSASMAGIIGLTHSYAQRLASDGITVNAITPGFIAAEDATTINHVSPDLIPVGRYGNPREVAAVAVMLAQNDFITGQNIHVNGGFLMA